jgi:predicted AAA+ superfamily ATPase
MKRLPRYLARATAELRLGYPAIAITGPRQSGKTTFAKMAFQDLAYVNLESPLERVALQQDPIGFLDRFPEGAVLDEIQNAPEALSYLQVLIDKEESMGRWVLTGSQMLDLNQQIAQSLAGRVAMLHLLPFSYLELAEAANQPTTLVDAVLRGGYPPLYDADRILQPARWLEDYLATFVKRDVPSVLAIRDQNAFDRFLRLCAAHTGQVLEIATLARDLGVSSKTVSSNPLKSS